jgi:hypothetical protein
MSESSFNRWLAESGWTITQMAELLGVSRQAVHAWKQGASKPSAEALAKLEVLSHGKVSARSFVTGGRPLIEIFAEEPGFADEATDKNA